MNLFVIINYYGDRDHCKGTNRFDLDCLTCSTKAKIMSKFQNLTIYSETKI